MNPQDHILIVDDDREIRTLLGDYLQKHGFRTSAVADGKGMWSALDSARVDLVILDVMLPGDDGFVLCRNLRARGTWPVIMLTAKGEDTDRIVGLELGADDYMPKPFNPRELLARIKSVLRRHRTVPDNLQPEPTQCVCASPAGRSISPRATSFRRSRWWSRCRARSSACCACSSSYPNRVLSRDQLMDLTVGREADPFDRSVDVQVSRLRQRLGDDAREPVIIKTVRGEGYVLAAGVEAV